LGAAQDRAVTRIENNVADRSRTNPVGWGVLRLQHSALPSGTARSGLASTMAPSSRANPVIRVSDLNPATRLDRKSTRLNSSHVPYTTLFRSPSVLRRIEP